MTKRWRLLVALALLCVCACQQQMANQPSYRPLAPSDFFADGRSARPLVVGTVARGQLRDDDALYRGKDAKGEPVRDFPFPVTDALLKRGQQRFNIFCSVCHGLTGEGDGRIVQRGFTRPPAFYPVPNKKDLDFISRYYKLRDQKKEIPLYEVPVGHIFDVATNGFGAMPGYAEQVPVRDRWAIVSYVRALQYSQSPVARASLQKAAAAKEKKK